jgi:hypothetical protein
MLSVLSLACAAGLSLACAAGAGCGLARLRVWPIIPISIIFVLISTVLGTYLDLRLGRIALIAFAVLTLLQVSYLVGSALSEAPRRHWASRPALPKRELIHAVQASIADELRSYFKTPSDDVHPRLRNKLALLETR